MIHSRAIVITVTKTIVHGEPLLGGLTTSFLEASKTWSGVKTPAYFLIRIEGSRTAVAWELGDIPSDPDAIKEWGESTPGIGRYEIVSYFDPMQPSQKSQRTRVEKKKVVSNGPWDNSMTPADVLPALRPLLTAEGRRECDKIWCFLTEFVQKTPGDMHAMEQFLAAMRAEMPTLHAADQFMKGIMSESMRAIAKRQPGVTMVACSWALDLRDGRPDFATIHKKAKELLECKPCAKPLGALDDDVDAEFESAKYF